MRRGAVRTRSVGSTQLRSVMGPRRGERALSGEVTSVGLAIDAALERAEELRRETDRPPRIRIMTIFGDDRSGLTINARIPSRNPNEYRCQEGLGTRCVPWSELDARAGELVGLVEDAVSEVTHALRNAPPTPRPSASVPEGQMVFFHDLVDELAGELSNAALQAMNDRPAKFHSGGLRSEATMMAAIKLAALAAYTGNMGIGDAIEELRLAFGRVLSKADQPEPELPVQRLN